MNPPIPTAAPGSTAPSPVPSSSPVPGVSPKNNVPVYSGPLSAARSKTRVRPPRLWQIGAAVLALALAGWGGQRWVFSGTRGAADITATATRADLPVIVTERGQLESARTT